MSCGSLATIGHSGRAWMCVCVCVRACMCVQFAHMHSCVSNMKQFNLCHYSFTIGIVSSVPTSLQLLCFRKFSC